MNIIHFQPEFRPALPCVFGAKDYKQFRADLIEADRILTETGLEERLIAAQIASYETPFPPRQLKRHIKTLRLALRHNILLAITGLSFRQLSLRLADSPLFQWFTHTELIDGVRPVSKSTLERFEKLIDVERVSEMIHELNQAVADAAHAEKLLYRQTALRFDEIFADTTCVKADIHFPVDWVLLRDATRTLVQAIILIREHGLKHRIAHPETFIPTRFHWWIGLHPAGLQQTYRYFLAFPAYKTGAVRRQFSCVLLRQQFVQSDVDIIV